MSARKAGRPSKLTPAIQEAICDAIRKRGAFRNDAAAQAGVNESTVSTWFVGGSRDDSKPELRAFHLAVLKAEADLIESLVSNVMNAAAHHPKLGLTFLSRRFPSRFGRKDNVPEQTAEDRANDAAVVRELVIERIERLSLTLAPAPVAALPALPAGGE